MTGAAALLVATPAFSAEPQAEQPAQAQSSPRQQIQAIQGKLTEIEQAALEANPELEEKREELQTMVQETMKENGHTPDEDVERLKQIQAKAQSGDLDQEERQALSQEFQETRQSLAGAQQQAMQDEEIQAAQQELQEATLEAMNEQDPQTEELLGKLKQLSAQLRQERPGRGAPQRPQ